MADFVDYKPNFGGAAAILQAAANVIAVAEKERMLRIAEWRNALLETPPCDGETVFIGINTAGFACCFNEVTRDGVCSMAGPEITTVQMSGLKWWRVLDRPDTSGVMVDAPAEREPWVPYLSDRADGVRGHYAICRWNAAGYREAWNLRSHRWASFSEEVLTLEEAQKLLAGLTLPSGVTVLPGGQGDA